VTARERARRKPAAVQTMLKAHCTRWSLEDPAPDWENYMADALDWWEQIVRTVRRDIDPGLSEEKIAEGFVLGLKAQEAWGHILRGQSN